MASIKPIETNKLKKAEVVNQYTGETWVYSETVKDHFFHPRNLLLDNPTEGQFDAEGMVGSPACGDMMTMWLKINPESEQITEMKWKTFGCGSAIASTSMFSVMITENGGMHLDEALKIKPQDVMKRLDGLPNRKIHCSVLADKAFRKTVNEYFRNIGRHDRVTTEGSRIVDKVLNITDKDIEEAVLEGAKDILEVQKKLKVGVGDPESIPEIEQLIRFYCEKYYG
ncbi:MAG: iron-sulfur cluster assembly scaffold protein [Candidatus Doudnabacteria bacterium]|nr:iron-sulfur cluster assembly scaffold protein [Candidatus Doudnabacteria bacterium]